MILKLSLISFYPVKIFSQGLSKILKDTVRSCLVSEALKPRTTECVDAVQGIRCYNPAYKDVCVYVCVGAHVFS